MHTIRVLSLSVAAVFLPCAQGSGAAVGLNELVRLALENNRQLAALRQRLPEARGLRRLAGTRALPIVEFSGTTGRPLGTVGEEQFSASYNYILETGDKRSRRIEVADLGITLVQAEFEERSREISFDLAVLYAGATAQQRKLERLDQLISLNRETMRLTEARVKEGDAALLEQQLLSVDINRTEAERLSTAGQLEAFLIELKQLAGIASSEPLNLSTAPVIVPVTDLRTLQERAAKERPDLRIARLAEQQSGSEARLTIAQGAPDVGLTANYARQYSRFDDQFGLTAGGVPTQLRDRDDVLTFGVQIPIGTRKRNQGNVEAASARAAAARLRREYLEARVAAEVATAHRKLIAVQSRFAVLDLHVIRQAEKNLEVIRQAYQLGQYRLLDVLAEQRRVVEMQLALVDAQAELARSIAELERSVGGNVQ